MRESLPIFRCQAEYPYRVLKSHTEHAQDISHFTKGPLLMSQPPFPSPEPPQAPLPAQPNAFVAFLQAKHAFPTWALIVAILLACGLGYASHGNAGATTTGATTGASVPTGTTTKAATKAPTVPTATATPAKPVTIASFSGTGPQNTADFHVNAPEWTLVWQCQPGQIGGNLIVEVDNADGSTLDYAPVNEICSGNLNGSTIERASGDFYLKVTADCDWQIQIQALP
jgi:hypothetical protein